MPLPSFSLSLSFCTSLLYYLVSLSIVFPFFLFLSPLLYFIILLPMSLSFASLLSLSLCLSFCLSLCLLSSSLSLSLSPYFIASCISLLSLPLTLSLFLSVFHCFITSCPSLLSRPPSLSLSLSLSKAVKCVGSFISTDRAPLSELIPVTVDPGNN